MKDGVVKMKEHMKRVSVNEKKILLVICAVALFLRLFGLDWDQGAHLHPDERFLTMVTAASSLPASLSEYLDPSATPLSPYNLNYPFYVYGAMPIAVIKVISLLFDLDSYTHIPFVGRVAGAFLDMSVVIFVYALTRLLTRRVKRSQEISLLASFFYAISVYPIQQAHFYTTDSFLQFFVYASLLTALLYRERKERRLLFMSAVFFAAALGSKIAGLYILPLIIAGAIVKSEDITAGTRSLVRAILRGALYFLISYISLRLLNPSMFAHSSPLDPALHPQFLNSLRQLMSFNTSEGYYPPGIQWMSKGALFSLQNVVVFGMGIPLGILMLKGFFQAGVSLFQKLTSSLKSKSFASFFRDYYLPLIVWGWAGSLFVYNSLQFVKSIRYMYILFPFFAMFAAWGVMTIKNPRYRITALVLALIWPASFMMIYTRPHSRVEASYWINENIPSGSVIATEYWDDGLPLLLPDIENRQYESIQLKVFDPDSESKWQEMRTQLERADYYILTSNRGWGSIMAVPEKYPTMSTFYRDLFDGKTQFVKVREFTSYPGIRTRLTGDWLSFPDQWSEEAFTVYDHPRVIIFQKK